MLFKSNNEYDPADAGCDDAHEAVADAAPVSAARRRLAKLLLQRDEAQGEMQKARDAIERLQAAASGPSAIEREIGALDLAEGSLISAWSSEGGDFPSEAQTSIGPGSPREPSKRLATQRQRAPANYRTERRPICARATPSRGYRTPSARPSPRLSSRKSGPHPQSWRRRRTWPLRLRAPNTGESVRLEHRSDPARSSVRGRARFYQELESSIGCARRHREPAAVYDRGPWARLAPTWPPMPPRPWGGLNDHARHIIAARGHHRRCASQGRRLEVARRLDTLAKGILDTIEDSNPVSRNARRPRRGRAECARSLRKG